MRGVTFTAEQLPLVYHTYKGKCLSPTGGLACTREHAHEREIVSNCKDTKLQIGCL